MLEKLLDEQSDSSNYQPLTTSEMPIVLGSTIEHGKFKFIFKFNIVSFVQDLRLYPVGPAVKLKSDRYADFVWPGTTYPKYISGGGYYMNYQAIELFRKLVRITPMIPIDDALTGIVFQRGNHQGTVSRNLGPFQFYFFLLI